MADRKLINELHEIEMLEAKLQEAVNERNPAWFKLEKLGQTA